MRNKYFINKSIEAVISKSIKRNQKVDMSELRESIRGCIEQDGLVPMPMADVNGEYKFPKDDDGGYSLTMEVIEDNNGNKYLPLYTSKKHIIKEATSPVIVDAPISGILINALDEDTISGVVINPFTQDVLLGLDDIDAIRMSLIY